MSCHAAACCALVNDNVSEIDSADDLVALFFKAPLLSAAMAVEEAKSNAIKSAVKCAPVFIGARPG
jgi:hypothetical protein